MSTIDIERVVNAFLPAKEITDIKHFAGREKLLQDSYLSLLSEGTYMALFGNRGIGKSSLARQIISMANGDNKILNKISYPSARKLDYLTVYYSCDDSIDNYESLLKKLLTTKDCLADWIYTIPTAYKEIQKINAGLDVGIAKVGSDIKTEDTETPIISSHDINVIFVNVVNEIVKQKISKDGILVIIDEYDRIKDSEGFAAFLKSASTNIPKVKFCIVGVAQDLQNLLRSHASSDRLFAGGTIYVPIMNPTELYKIIDNAENEIEHKIEFNKEARDKMIYLAQGHPYIIHLIGKYALLKAFTDKKNTVNVDQINDTLNQIAYNNVDPILERRYNEAVRSSLQREIVLKEFAKVDTTLGDIHTAPVYKKCIDLGVDNPSVYVGQLVLPEYGAEFLKVRDGYYRFKDSLFKAYSAAHPSLQKT